MIASAAAVAANGNPAFRDWRTLRDLGIVRQSRDYSCGAAALATLLSAYYEREVDEAAVLGLLADPSPGLRLPANWETAGMSFATLAVLAAEFGLQGQGVSLVAAELPRLRVPAIAHLQRDGWSHFSVIAGVDPGGAVQLADPAWGNRRLSAHQFRELWLDPVSGRGRLLLFYPAPDTGPAGEGFGVSRPQPALRSQRGLPLP